jgi:hypothetical protein
MPDTVLELYLCFPILLGGVFLPNFALLLVLTVLLSACVYPCLLLWPQLLIKWVTLCTFRG